MSTLKCVGMAMSLLCIANAAQAADPMLSCLISPDQVIELGSPIVGILDNVAVDRGQIVKKGQIVAQLYSQVESANVSVAKERALNKAELQAALANEEYTKRRSERSASLVQQNFISPQAHDQTATEAQLAQRRVAASMESQSVAERELLLAEAQLAQRTIRSPISGVVVERYLDQGERVEEKPILKLAALDPLRVEVVAPSSLFARILPGMKASVTPEMPGMPSREAIVSSVDRVIDPASNSFRIRLALPNPRYTIPSGLRCKIAMEEGLEEQKAEATPAALDMSAKIPAAVKNKRM